MFIREPFEKITDDILIEKIKNDAVSKMKEILYKNDNWYADYVRLRMKAVKIK